MDISDVYAPIEVVSGICVTHHLVLALTEEHFHELRIHERGIVTEITGHMSSFEPEKVLRLQNIQNLFIS